MSLAKSDVVLKCPGHTMSFDIGCVSRVESCHLVSFVNQFHLSHLRRHGDALCSSILVDYRRSNHGSDRIAVLKSEVKPLENNSSHSLPLSKSVRAIIESVAAPVIRKNPSLASAWLTEGGNASVVLQRRLNAD
jgi:hypothetical protein